MKKREGFKSGRIMNDATQNFLVFHSSATIALRVNFLLTSVWFGSYNERPDPNPLVFLTPGGPHIRFFNLKIILSFNYLNLVVDISILYSSDKLSSRQGRATSGFPRHITCFRHLLTLLDDHILGECSVPQPFA